MYIISANKKNIIWDIKNDKPLAHFKKGTFKTDDKAIAQKLEKMGFELEEATIKKAKSVKEVLS